MRCEFQLTPGISVWEVRRTASLSSEQSHELCFSQDVAFGRSNNFFLRSPWSEIERCIQGIKPEPIMVRAARRRAGAAVADAAKIVPALHAAAGDLGQLRNTFR